MSTGTASPWGLTAAFNHGLEQRVMCYFPNSTPKKAPQLLSPLSWAGRGSISSENGPCYLGYRELRLFFRCRSWQMLCPTGRHLRGDVYTEYTPKILGDDEARLCLRAHMYTNTHSYETERSCSPLAANWNSRLLPSDRTKPLCKITRSALTALLFSIFFESFL